MSEVEVVGPQALPELQARVERILAEAGRQGATACEVAVSVEQGLSTTVRQREVETVEFNRDQGFGITLYVGQRKGSASTSATGDDAIRETVAAALAIARHASEDECAGLADRGLMARDLPDLDLYHPWAITPSRRWSRRWCARRRPSMPTPHQQCRWHHPQHSPGLPRLRQQPRLHRRLCQQPAQPELRDDRRWRRADAARLLV